LGKDYKLYFKYIYFNLPHLYLSYTKKNFYNLSLIVPSPILYYSALHLRFSTIFFTTQLVDMFAYDLPTLNSTEFNASSSFKRISNSITVYNYHHLFSQDRFFFFCTDINVSESSPNFNLASISELFPNASWLEREVSELSGIVFSNKKDLRNLMLQYGDTTVPFLKTSPSIGFKEMFYDSLNDFLVETPVTVQV
jgi:NADH-quinone oxidoreductase subunit C